ncbi:MAG: biotin--[Selenomonadaceae bacterium]|nr:biotin--[acetyl-CoA-carboxylase] ligase [Selenomonadaceae bacterium]
MRREILKILRESNGKFVSGESIAKKFNISRTAVWKHVQGLRKIGYTIDSVVKSGYALYSPPDLLLPDEISNGLETKIIGREIIYFDSTNSTNEQAKRIINERKNQIEDGILLVTESQTEGKGRLDRKFYSPYAKGILFSIIIRPDVPLQDAPKFTLAIAAAISQAMEDFGLKPGIKWPNDIMYKGKKLVGILTEMSAEIDRVHCIIIGCGINFSIEKFPPEIEEIATSIEIMRRDLGVEKFSRVQFLQRILIRFDDIYREILSHGFEKTLNMWKKYSITLGKSIKVIPAGEIENSFEGRAIDLDSSGALIVEKLDGSKVHVLAGDVSIR